MTNYSNEERSKSKDDLAPLTGEAIVQALNTLLQNHITLMQGLLRKLSTLNVHYPKIRNELLDIEQDTERMIALIRSQQRTIESVHDNEEENKLSEEETSHSPTELEAVFHEPVEKSKEKILIIDDDYEIRYFIKNVLHEHYHIAESGNGFDGYEKAIDIMPDLIISDVIMPGMNGIELCKKIKADFRTSHIPIILLTARTATPERMEGFEAGADAYINKPFNTLELTLHVKNLFETLQNQRKKYEQDIFQTPRQITTNSTDEIFLHRLIKYVEDNIDDPGLDISGLANELNMSSSNLYRKVKSITGMSSLDFVINHKMKFAAHLLLSGSYSVKEVAYKVGFTDARYFSTRFKKYFKHTPTEYYEVTIEKMHDLN